MPKYRDRRLAPIPGSNTLKGGDMVACLGLCNHVDGYCLGCGQDLAELSQPSSVRDTEEEPHDLVGLPGTEDIG